MDEFDISEGLLTPEEVAALYGVRRATAITWARNQRLPAMQTPGGSWRFSKAAVRRDREARRTTWGA
jgi:excisionase family DNA binding protein